MPTVRIVEKQKLLKTTNSTGTPSSTAVASAPRADSRPPSPTRQITLRSGAPIFAPMAAPGAKPIVAMPPLVMNGPGRDTCSCWPAPFLFQPTSVTKIASSGASFGELMQQPRGMNRRAVVVLALLQLRFPRRALLGELRVTRRARGAVNGVHALRRWRISSRSVAFASPTSPTSTG